LDLESATVGINSADLFKSFLNSTTMLVDWADPPLLQLSSNSFDSVVAFYFDVADLVDCFRGRDRHSRFRTPSTCMITTFRLLAQSTAEPYSPGSSAQQLWTTRHGRTIRGYVRQGGRTRLERK
jgi:hypothetical protein